MLIHVAAKKKHKPLEVHCELGRHRSDRNVSGVDYNYCNIRVCTRKTRVTV